MKTDKELWFELFTALLSGGNVSVDSAEGMANMALETYKKRWSEDTPEAKPKKEKHVFIHPEARFYAVDKDGAKIESVAHPIPGKGQWGTYHRYLYWIVGMQDPFNDDSWKDTLEERQDE